MTQVDPYAFTTACLSAIDLILLGVILCLVVEMRHRSREKTMSNSNFGKISKNLHGANYGNPYQAPYVENEYSQNVPPPKASGGGAPYDNPYSDLGVVESQFFEPATPNDPAFSDMQAPNEISVADPIGQIMSDFSEAQSKMHNNGGK